jgi:hypothetical protein
VPNKKPDRPIPGVPPTKEPERVTRHVPGVTYPMRPEDKGDRELRCRNPECRALFISGATLEFIRAQGPPFYCYACKTWTDVPGTQEA